MLISTALILAGTLACRSLPGAQQLWKNPDIRFIVVGEMHGTTETPDVFGDLVCNALTTHRPLLVAVEEPDSEQIAITRFLNSDGGEEAKATFRRSIIWSTPYKDGRSSTAYFDLFQRLRGLKGKGDLAQVVAFEPTEATKQTATETGYNAAMAGRLRAAAARHPGALVLVLVGNVHARKRPVRLGSEIIIPAAADLPARQTISLNVPAVGKAWNCPTATLSAADCGPQIEPGNLKRGRAVVLHASRGAPYDGEITLGVPTTASPPAVASSVRQGG